MSRNDDIYNICETVRRLYDASLNEDRTHSEYTAEDSKPYTSQDEIYNQSLETMKKQFGANFANVKGPMRYYPKSENRSENVSLSGEISSLNNAKFQFWLQDENNGSCLISCDMLRLTDKVVELLGVVYGAFENWQKDVRNLGDMKPMSMRGNDDEEGTSGMVPGDDYGSN